jgi:hypothetical protein
MIDVLHHNIHRKGSRRKRTDFEVIFQIAPPGANSTDGSQEGIFLILMKNRNRKTESVVLLQRLLDVAGLFLQWPFIPFWISGLPHDSEE